MSFVSFGRSWDANAVLQMKIPAAARYNVLRGGWEFAFTGLRRVMGREAERGGGGGDWGTDLVAVAAGANDTRTVC